MSYRLAMFRRPALLACEGFLALWIALGCLVALADTPASFVTRTVVGPGQAYPEVAANSEAWFDVGGFCKVVDVGSLTWTNPQASAVPVFIPGSAAQWKNYRTVAPNAYHGDLILTTCCRAQANIATLCASATNPQPVSRQYGRLGETDIVTATCIDAYGQYTESAQFTCTGATGVPSADNGPDGQAVWTQTTGDSDVCGAGETITGACQGTCGTGTQSVVTYNGCGVVTSSTRQQCALQPCSPPPVPCAQQTLSWGYNGECSQVFLAAADGSTETQSVSDESGNCTQSATFACDGGTFSFSAGYCNPGCSPNTCPASTVSWGTPAACEGSLPAAASGTITSVTDTLGVTGSNGNAIYNCDYGNWTQVSGSCTAPAGSCPVGPANSIVGPYPGCVISCQTGFTASTGRNGIIYACKGPPQDCPTQVVTWGSPGLCSDTVTAAASGTQESVSDRLGAAGYYGAAVWGCSNGIWGLENNYCNSNSTGCPPAPANGYVTAAPDCTVYCNGGYNLVSGSCVPYGPTGQSCPAASPVWGSPALCAGSIPVTASGGSAVASDNLGASGTAGSAVYKCNSGIWVQTSESCSSGTTCPAAPATGTVGAYPSCTVTCNSGYELSGGYGGYPATCAPSTCTPSCGACSQGGLQTCTASDCSSYNQACTPIATAASCSSTIEVWGNYCAAYFSGASGASDTESTVLSSTPGYIGCNGSATYSCSNGALTFVSGTCSQNCSNATTCNPSSVTNGTVGAYPGCAITCNSGYTLSNGRCVAIVCPATCTVANGTCSYGAAPSCAVTITGCNSGYTVSNGSCVAIGCPPTCTIANGTCSYGAAPSCAVTITGCNSGYTVSNGSCVAVGCPPTCTVANGTCTYGAAPSCPESIICNPGYTLSGNVCVANAPVCQPSLVTTCGACSQTTGKKSCITTDINNCPGSTSTPSTQNCALLPVGQWTCTFSVPDYLPDSGPPWSTSPPATGGYIEYWDCGYQGDPNGYSWVCAPGGLCSDTPGVTCYDDPCVQKEPYVHFNADGTSSQQQLDCGVNSQTCIGYK